MITIRLFGNYTCLMFRLSCWWCVGVLVCDCRFGVLVVALVCWDLPVDLEWFRLLISDFALVCGLVGFIFSFCLCLMV